VAGLAGVSWGFAGIDRLRYAVFPVVVSVPSRRCSWGAAFVGFVLFLSVGRHCGVVLCHRSANGGLFLFRFDDLFLFWMLLEKV